MRKKVVQESRAGGARSRRRPYFSYGSNIVAEQMALRCPGARLLGKGRLHGFEFRICRSGYATAVPRRGAVLHGLVWLIGPKDERALDIYEEVETGLYRKTRCLIELDNGERLRALIYIATRPTRGRARAQYLEPIIASAVARGFPPEVVLELSRWRYA